MDRQTLRNFNERALVALKELAAELDLEIRQENSRFGDSNAILKYSLMDVGDRGEAVTPESEAWGRSAARYGFYPEDLGGTFSHNGATYKITGLKTRRPKYPICATNLKTGKSHKFPPGLVKNIQQPGTGRRAAIKAQRALGPLSDEAKAEFLKMLSELTPERLSLDGERSPSGARSARSFIMRRWRALESEIGCKVSELDAYRFEFEE